jgi:hypothetical protein
MSAKVSSTGLRFFSHESGNPDCPSLGETLEHRELKRVLSDHARPIGWKVELEAQPADSDVGGWRADVLLSHPNGRRVALEVQLAGMTVEDGMRREATYANDNIETIWVSSRHASWMLQIPGIRLEKQDVGVAVTRGFAKIDTNISSVLDYLHWQPLGPFPLSGMMKMLFSAPIKVINLHGYYEHIGGSERYINDATLMVTEDDYALYLNELRRNVQRQAEEERRYANTLALNERQSRVLQIAFQEAVDIVGNEKVWIGVPSIQWKRGVPVPDFEAEGGEKMAFGLVLWTGPAKYETKQWAVICPVASRLTPGFGRLWAQRGVRVYVETLHEASRVEQALGWAHGSCQIRGPSLANRPDEHITRKNVES